MKRVLSITALIISIAAVGGTLQAAPPAITVSLALDKTTYGPGEPILATLSLVNSGGDIITVEGFSGRDFYLMLQFSDESGTVVTSNQFSDTSTLFPALPRVFPDAGGELIQGDLIEIIEAGWVLAYNPFEVLTYYQLANRGSRYSAKAVIPIRTYADYLQTAAGVKYAPLDTVAFYGSLQSNAVSFTLTGDRDGDGYYYPQAYGEHTQADCDDANAQVNPGAAEILYNGIDDDCNPATADVVVVTPGTIEVTVEKHTTGKKGQKSQKEPIEDLLVKVFDKSEGSCVRNFGVSPHNYRSVWLSCAPQDGGVGQTDEKGMLVMRVAPGDYVIVAEYDPDVYEKKDNEPGNEIYLGVSASDLAEGQYMKKLLQLIVKPN